MTNVKKIQTTDKTTDTTFTLHEMAELIKIDMSRLNKSVIFVQSGATSKGLEIVKLWIDTGKVVSKIKAAVDKDQFKKAIDSLYGTHFNNNQRAYCMRLAQQRADLLISWYTTEGIQAIGCKLVFELFCKAYKDDAVNPPATKKTEKSTKSTETTKDDDDKDTDDDDTITTVLKVSQAFTLYLTLRDKLQESGDLTLTALETLVKVVETELSDLRSALALEIKAEAVDKVRLERVKTAA